MASNTTTTSNSPNKLPSSSSSSPTKAPLTELSPNTTTTMTSPTKPSHSSSPSKPSAASNTKDENANPHHPYPHQQHGKQDQQTYISPSDTIMSPTTKKLSAIKGRRFAGAGKGQEQKSLFARTVGRQQALRDGGGEVAGKGTGVGGEVGKGGD